MPVTPAHFITVTPAILMLVNPAHFIFVTPAQAGVQFFELCARMKHPCVYMLASKKYGTLYIGVTSDLIKRIWEHKSNAVEGFTKQYDVHVLVWFEQHETMESAISREKALKAWKRDWKRDWKLNLIESMNPEWRDLYPGII